jgi:hypothetical protein
MTTSQPAATDSRPSADKPPDDLLGTARLIIDAAHITQLHVEHNGWCHGCLTAWARLAPHPCTQARWAQRVLDQSTVQASINWD